MQPYNVDFEDCDILSIVEKETQTDQSQITSKTTLNSISSKLDLQDTKDTEILRKSKIGHALESYSPKSITIIKATFSDEIRNSKVKADENSYNRLKYCQEVIKPYFKNYPADCLDLEEKEDLPDYPPRVNKSKDSSITINTNLTSKSKMPANENPPCAPKKPPCLPKIETPPSSENKSDCAPCPPCPPCSEVPPCPKERPRCPKNPPTNCPPDPPPCPPSCPSEEKSSCKEKPKCDKKSSSHNYTTCEPGAKCENEPIIAFKETSSNEEKPCYFLKFKPTCKPNEPEDDNKVNCNIDAHIKTIATLKVAMKDALSKTISVISGDSADNLHGNKAKPRSCENDEINISNNNQITTDLSPTSILNTIQKSIKEADLPKVDDLPDPKEVYGVIVKSVESVVSVLKAKISFDGVRGEKSSPYDVPLTPESNTPPRKPRNLSQDSILSRKEASQTFDSSKFISSLKSKFYSFFYQGESGNSSSSSSLNKSKDNDDE